MLLPEIPIRTFIIQVTDDVSLTFSEPTLEQYAYLSKIKTINEDTPENTANVVIDLITALLYGYDGTYEEKRKHIASIPIIYVNKIVNELLDSIRENDKKKS